VEERKAAQSPLRGGKRSTCKETNRCSVQPRIEKESSNVVAHKHQGASWPQVRSGQHEGTKLQISIAGISGGVELKRTAGETQCRRAGSPNPKEPPGARRACI
jgi:hypothetical protein